MSQPKIKAIPESRRVTPHLSVRNGAKAIEFYKRAFGATETMRLEEPSGRLGHAELEIGGACFMLADEYPEVDSIGPETLGGTSVCLNVHVEDVDALAERAIAAGATLLRPIADQFYGERVALLKDPFGHKWTFASRIEEVSPEEMQRRFAGMVDAQ